MYVDVNCVMGGVFVTNKSTNVTQESGTTVYVWYTKPECRLSDSSVRRDVMSQRQADTPSPTVVAMHPESGSTGD